MKQYIVTEEQIKAVENLLTRMCNNSRQPASLQAAIDVVTAGLRNHEYVKTSSDWVPPVGQWTYTYRDLPITCEQKEYLDQLALDKAVKEAEAANANNKYKE